MAHDALFVATSASLRDVALADLSADERAALDDSSVPWLNSLGYCTIYTHPPAERVCLAANEPDSSLRATFYRQRRWLGMFRMLEIAGFPSVADDDILKLLSSRRCHRATVHRMLPPDSSETHRAGMIPLTHDVIADLPLSKEDYFQSLGKQKRQQLPRYWRRLQREFNDQVEMRFELRDAINPEEVFQLVRFNQMRMETQGKDNTAEMEIEKQRRRWPLAETLGMMCKLMAGDRLLGGTFNYVHGKEAFLIVIAHDPAHEHLNIGNVCLWKTIDHLIDMGVTRYHLFWGRKRYKTDFGGLDFPVMLAAVSRHRWMILFWKWQMTLKLQVPRVIRFVRFGWRRVFRRANQSRSASGNESASDTAGAEADSAER